MAHEEKKKPDFVEMDRDTEKRIETWLKLEDIVSFDTEKKRIKDFMADFTPLLIFAIDKSEAIEELEKDLELIKKLPPSKAFKRIDEVCVQYITSKLQDHLPRTSKNYQYIESIIVEKNWKNIQAKSAEQYTWLRIYSMMLDLRGDLVNNYIDQSKVAQEKLHPLVQLEYKYFAEITNVTNVFFMEWLKNTEQFVSTEQRIQMGFLNPCAIVGFDKDDKYIEIPWHEAYPEKIEKLASLYKDLASDLQKNLQNGKNPEIQKIYINKIAYYKTLVLAYKTSKEENFKKADLYMMRQVTDRDDTPFHVHSIEKNYFGLQRIIEASLRFPNHEYDNINKQATKTRDIMAEMLKKFLIQYESLNCLAPNIESIRKGKYTARHFMGAGSEMIFTISGHVVPCSAEVIKKTGIDVSSDAGETGKRIEFINNMASKVFKKEAGKIFLDPKKLAKYNGCFVASHEFGHVIGNILKIFTRLNESLVGEFIEEWKSTVAGVIHTLVACYNTHTFCARPEQSLDKLTELREWIIFFLANDLYFASKRQDASGKPYMREGIMIARLTEKVGIIQKKNDDAYGFDFSDTKILHFFDLLQAQYIDILHIYASGNTKNLKKFLQKNLKPCSYIEWLFQKIDMKLQKKGMPTVSELCSIPNIL